MADAPRPAPPSRFEAVRSRLYDAYRRYRWPWIVGVLLYGGLALLFLRADFGTAPGALPQGTNALNTYTLYLFQQHYGLSVWLSPYTDWGQPLPDYPGLDPQ
ncbi:MAG TPA: hypothetical protein VMG36_03420, partial [Thermoplasmata archaeon]|nr:hypothetical protein [Thermoplasmata archaeon]